MQHTDVVAVALLRDCWRLRVGIFIKQLERRRLHQPTCPADSVTQRRSRVCISFTDQSYQQHQQLPQQLPPSLTSTQRTPWLNSYQQRPLIVGI